MSKTTVDEKLAQSHKIAIVLDPDMNRGKLANRSAVLATGLAVHHPEIMGPDTATADNITLPGITKVPIVVLQARNNREIPELALKSRRLNCTTLVYLAHAQGLRSYNEYMHHISGKTEESLDVDAFLIYGPRKKVEKVTGNLAILR